MTAISLGLSLRTASNDLLGELGAGHAAHLTIFLQLGFAAQDGLPPWGELLPHHFTLTTTCRGGLFSVALSVREETHGLPVRKYGALCCPDFPPR